MPSPLTVSQHVAQLIPRLRRENNVPVWPADVFGICATLLVKSGSYCRVSTYWPPHVERVLGDIDPLLIAGAAPFDYRFARFLAAG